MDEATAILLSRYLDSDLTAAEREDFEAALATDEALAGELKRYRELRGAVHRIVRSVEPPVRLDAIIEPLRMRPADRLRVRPAVRWLAAAAAAVVGVTVALEVARRQPGPASPATVGVAAEAKTRPTPTPGHYQLQPLPRFVDDSGEDRLGAADRLLATPHAEPEVDQPEALEVIGPLPTTAEARAAGLDEAGEEGRVVGGGPAEKVTAKDRGREEILIEDAGSGVATTAARQTAGEGVAKGRLTAVLRFSVGGTERTRAIRAARLPPAGRYPIVLEIAEGRVQDVDAGSVVVPVAATSWRAVTAALVGQRVIGVDDGPLRATLEVRPPP